MWTTVRSLALLAVAVPATAYVVLQTVVDESATAGRPVVVLEEASGTQQPSAGGDAAGRPGSRQNGAGGDRPGSPGPTGTAERTPCDDDDAAEDRADDLDDDLGDDDDDDAGDDVSVVRPCPTDVREDDPGDRDDVEDD